MQSNSDLEKANKEMSKLRTENLDLDTRQQVTELQESLAKITTANQANIEAVKKAILTQEDRRKAFPEAFQKAFQKQNTKSIFSILFDRIKTR